ncbi:MAG: hypothetical protein LC623_04315 [Halobacteriales archaeon]|nr:hypothetical protein [Halobacteriales archaeon]
MADTPLAPLTPQQAAQALAGIAQYEEGLTTRVGALTGMVWGIVSAAIFVTYGVAPSVSPMWLMPLLWVPWTLAGIAVTASAWKLHAVTLRGPGAAARSWTWSLGFAALFVVALLGLHLLRLGHGAFPYMLVVNGLVAFVIVAAASRRRGRLTATPMLVAGVLIVAGAFAIGAAGMSSLVMAFASAALVGSCYVGAGLVAFVRG